MKIAVIHATAGAGHKMAALAITNGINARGNHQVECIDALDYTNPFFKAMYPASYVFLVTKLPWAWKIFFSFLDRPSVWPFMRFIRRIYNRINAYPLEKFLIDQQYDVIYCTHFLSAEVAAYLKRSGKIKSRLICCVTDFDVHRIWVNEGIDVYSGACDFTKKKLMSLGVQESAIVVTGIPVDEKFSIEFDHVALRKQFQLSEHKLIVLIATGSFGIGPIAQLIDALGSVVSLLVVCGHNKNLYEELKGKANQDVHIFSLVQNMHELMAVSDVMITKPGGLSVAEALSVRLPLVFISAIPGQETGNINVLKSYGAADEQMPLDHIVARIKEVSQNPSELSLWKERLVVLSKPHAVAELIKLI